MPNVQVTTNDDTVQVITAGAQGPPGQGVPTGGTTGQVLAKNSDTDFDTEWVTGGGGTSDHADLTNLDYASAGHTGFAGTEVENTFTADQNIQGSVNTNTVLVGLNGYGAVTVRNGLGSPTITLDGSTGTVQATVIAGSGTGLTALSADNVTSGTLAVARGGTGQTTATTAFNALAPAQTGNAGKYLTTNGTAASWGTVTAPTIPTFALAQGTPVTTGANKTNVLIVPLAGTITRAWAAAKTGPTGADLVFDINLNGTTIWSTQANRLKITAGSTTGNTTTFDTAVVSAGDQLTIDVDQVGSTIAGQDITVSLLILVTT
jgi:hypothetical protein